MGPGCEFSAGCTLVPSLPGARRLAGVSRCSCCPDGVTAQRAWPDPGSSDSLGPFGKPSKSQRLPAGTPLKGVRIPGGNPHEGLGTQQGSVHSHFHGPSGAMLPDSTLLSSSHSPP